MSTNHQSKPGQDHTAGPDKTESVLQPASGETAADSTVKAVELIRQKLAAIYGDEPNAKQELAEAMQPGVQHSKHQRFMQSLHNSGKPMSQIQAEWHQYYADLDDQQKHEVWQEFYSHSAQVKQQASRLNPQYQYQPDEPATTPKPEPSPQPDTQSANVPAAAVSASPTVNPLYSRPAASQEFEAPAAAATPASANGDDRPVDQIRQQIRNTISSRGKLKAKHHLQSLLFGLGFGALVLVVVLFGFLNEVVIAPFIQPSRQVSATPIIVSPDSVTPSDQNEVLIPKINVQIPLDFSAKTTNEKEFEAALDKGVAHYPTTALPGQKGNASFFGHSSNNIFNPGKYKFAFVMLNELVPGDTFYINYNGVTYAYQVYDKRIVEATEISILNPVPNKEATAMLVTCDPPGTSLRRLAVWGEQVSPNPNGNIAATAPGGNATSEALPGNGPTLWGRIFNIFR